LGPKAELLEMRVLPTKASAMSRFANRFRHLAPGALLLIAALAPFDAHAQLRGLGGSGPGIGGIGALGSGSAASPGLSGAPLGSVGNVGSDLRTPQTGPTSSIPQSPIGRTTVTNSVTNTLNGDVTAPIANTAGRARTALGDTVNRIGENAGIARAPLQGRSRVPPVGEQRFVANEVLVGLPSNLTPQALDALALRYGLTRLESQRIGLTGTTFHRWQIADQRSVADVIRGLEADVGVRVAQPNYRFTLQQDRAAPAAARGDVAQYALEKLHIAQAHQLATGEAVLIAVIDGGIDASHPEIAGDIAESFDALDAPRSLSVHGTAMAGAIVAHARLMGVAPSARILAIRAFGASGGGDESTTLAVLKSIDWAVSHRARVINMSFAGPQDPEIARSLAAASRKGVVLVAAAGNAGPNSAPLYPAADPNVIAVTATDSADHLFAKANRGRHIAVAAPGVDILAPAPGNAYQLTTGTSVAAAEVSGLVALLLEAKSNLTPQAVRKILMSSARDLGPKGPDDQFGAGLADAQQALLSLTATVARAPTTSASAAH
jgi:subtilisin family serine protease